MSERYCNSGGRGPPLALLAGIGGHTCHALGAIVGSEAPQRAGVEGGQIGQVLCRNVITQRPRDMY